MHKFVPSKNYYHYNDNDLHLFIETSCALQCYDCGNGQCPNATITENTPKVDCTEGQMCGSSSSYINGTLKSVMRLCVDKDGGECENMCTKPDSKGLVDCLACCSTSLCNTEIPGAPKKNSGSAALSPPLLPLLLVSVLLCLGIQLLSYKND